MEALTFKDNRAVTANGSVGVVMLIISGESAYEDGVRFRYFEYMTKFFEPPTRIEWDVDITEAVLPPEVAGHLIKSGYARDMTKAEMQAYNDWLDKPEAVLPLPKLEKGDPK